MIYLKFVLDAPDPNKKTFSWTIQSLAVDKVSLGIVKFYPNWRKYCYFPANNIILDTFCLSEIASFLIFQTQEWRNGLIK